MTASTQNRFILAAVAAIMATGVLSFSPTPAHSQTPAPPANSSIESLLEKELSLVRATRADLSVRPSRWDTRSKLPSVESLLDDPLKTPTIANQWADALSISTASSDLIRFAAPILDVSLEMRLKEEGMERPLRREREIPKEIQSAVKRLLQAISAAQLLLDKAVASLSAEERERVLSTVTSIVAHQDDRRLQSADFDVMARFDRASMLQAAHLLTQAADKAIPELQKGAPALKHFASRRWSAPSGDVLLSSQDDDVYTAKDMQDTALLIDLGGNNRYEGPAAAASAGKIRIVIDLGENITIASGSGMPAGGSGIFGIGLLYLPNPNGKKILQAEDFSLGAGLFGVGGLFAEGSSVQAQSHHFSQGAGAFGLGLFQAGGTGNRYGVRYAGQGFGFTGGMGVFLHRGNGAQMDGGLFYPDPREGLAGVSLSQGVGYGPRALSAGGVGIALVAGDHNALNSSYFAQGSGYWHGFGNLFVIGNENHLQARRYDQGAGVHTAVGALVLRGNKNQLVNWGVGPAYGWDYGVGLWTIEGDDNQAQTDWATGHGDYNGHAFAFIRGDRNRLLLPDFGSGELSRGAPGYAITMCIGSENILRSPPKQGNRGAIDLQSNPWGVFHAEGRSIFDPTLASSQTQWPQFDREQEYKRELAILDKRLSEAEKKSAPERIAEWLSIASTFGLGAAPEGKSAEKLLALPPEEIPILAASISPDYFDEFVWLRALLAAYGRPGTAAVIQQISSLKGMKKALTISSLSSTSAEQTVPSLIQAVNDPDWRVRRAVAGALGYLFDQETGNEPGRRQMLNTAAEHFPQSYFPKNWTGLLKGKRLTDLYAFLALNPLFSVQDRIAVLGKSRNPYDPVGPEAAQDFIRVLNSHWKAYQHASRQENRAIAILEPQVREALLQLTHDKDTDVIQAAMVALGQIGRIEDAPMIASFLDNDKAILREAAAVSLAKMGKPARWVLQYALKSGLPRTRAMAVLAIAQSSYYGTLKLLHSGLADPDPEVRSAAITAISRFQSPNWNYRGKFIKDLTRLETSDPSPSIRATASRAKASIPH